MIRANTLKRSVLSSATPIVSFFLLLLPVFLHAQCSPDTTRPRARCRNTTIYLDTVGEAGLNPLQIDNGSTDNCREWYLILIHPCFYCSDIGNKNVTLYVQDRAGNKSNCTAVVTVRDTTRPKLSLKTTHSANLSSGSATVTAQQLVASLSDNCSSLNKIQLGIRKIGQGTGFPLASSLSFACADTGRQYVEVWARDSSGNAVTRTTSFTVTDLNRSCTPTIRAIPTIIGNIRNEAGKPITAQVTLSGGNAPTPTVIKTSDYHFSNILRGGSFTLTAKRDTDWLNGVTSYDIALMSQHALDIVPITSPYKLIAGDVDKDGYIDASDMLLTRRLILRQIGSISGNTAWRFIPKNTILPPSPTSPLIDIQESMTFNNVVDTVREADFVAIKTCDVSGSAQNFTSGNGSPVQVRTKGVELLMPDKLLEADKIYETTVTISETDIVALQFTLAYNQSKIRIKDIQSVDLQGFSQNNFALYNDKGLAAVSWNSSLNNKLKAGSTFKLVFEALQSARLSQVIDITSDVTQAESYNIGGSPSEIRLKFTTQDNMSDSDLILLPNAPNPFSQETIIRFRLPAAAEIELTVYDETGRILKSIKRAFAKGYNEIPLIMDTPSVSVAQVSKPSGLLFYRIQTPTHSATQRMVIMK